MKKPTNKPSFQSGFSLVELLVVIAVIAVIAAIAIPNIAGITGGANDAKNRRNAQNFASLASAAVAAGHAGTNTVAGWVTLLTNGITVTNSFGGTNGTFKVDGISSTDASNAVTFLTNSGNNLVYKPSTN
ncbi:MAG: prepilin-type N-terminal cleavage/methylation domain-containing protein [Chthoniobacterales bacterium]|nr:prepilin-type N-terminal cleavage/methylation domain-containing protein [Chthoniobacterales bacterium]